MTANEYQPVPATILGITRETAVDATFRIACTRPVAGGQFLQVSLPGVGEAPISVSDWGDGWVDLTIRNVGCLTRAVHALPVGARLFIRGPYGNGWPVAAFRGRHLVIAAGGTGLAPVRGLINRLAAGAPPLRGFDLLLGFKTPDDILFREDIARWRTQLRLTLTVDKAGPDWSGHTGLVTAFIPKLELPAAADCAVVVVGPPLMMKFTALESLRRGIPEDRLWLSFERRMQCGIGKCGHCKIDDTYVCLDGPVFPYPKAKTLMD